MIYIFQINQKHIKRIEFKIRSSETDMKGQLQFYLISSLKTNTILCPFDIPALNLHYQMDVEEKIDYLRTCNELHIKGKFSLNQIHSWLSHLLPQIAHHCTEKEQYLHYQHMIVATTLSVYYTSNQAIFKSDNMITLYLIQRYIEAISKQFRLSIESTIQSNDLIYYENLLDVIADQLYDLYQLYRQYQLLPALSEIYTNNDDEKHENLAVEYQHIITQSKSLTSNYKLSSFKLKFYKDYIIQLYQIRYKLQSRPVPDLSRLQQLLTDQYNQYDFKAIKQLFTT